MYTEQDKQAAMKTSLTPPPTIPICYPIIQKIGVTGSVLDFGCGIHKRHTHRLAKTGATKIATYDFHFPETKDAIFAEQYDCVIASNVINVQTSIGALRQTLREIQTCLHPNGFALANYPKNPRKMKPEPLDEIEMRKELEQFFIVEKLPKDLCNGHIVFKLSLKDANLG